MSWSIKSELKKIIAGEIGTIKKDWGGRLSIALVYPNTYHVGMSNLGVHNVYRLANEKNNIVCERAFLPEKNLLLEYKRTNTPLLSLESMRPLAEFDIVAFSIAFENDIENIKTIFDLARIFKAKGPKLIAGGAAATLNPQAFKDIFDEVVVGDADEWFTKDLILSRCRADVQAFRHSDVKTPACQDACTPVKHPARSIIWTNNTEFGNMHLVEMQRGCPHGCKFCAAPVIYRPFKQFSKDEIINAIKTGLPHKKKIGLIGGDILAHPHLEEILEFIHSQGATFSPSSLRADRMTSKIAKLLKQSGHKTITLAPETSSEKLRTTLGKNISDEAFFTAAVLLIKEGIKQFKLYFMIGLPNETDKDIEGIKNFILRFKKLGVTKISATINPFVPKRKTAFEAANFAGIDVLKRKISILKNMLGKEGGLNVRFESPLSSLKEYETQL